MKRTFFTLGKQAVQNRTHSSASLNINKIEADPSAIVGSLLTSFSDATKHEFMHNILQTCCKSSIREIKQYTQQGTEFITNRNKRNPLASLQLFEKSVEIATTLLAAPKIEITDDNTKILATAYAGYADVLQKFKIEEIDTIKIMVEKALKLDPNNKLANEINLDMRFYNIVPESTVKIPTT